MIYRKVLEVARTGAIPIVLGGDHSITWPSATAIAEVRRPGSIGIVHFDAHADTANDAWGVLASHGSPMRRLIESGAVSGKNFVQVGLRGYWPPPETFAWMKEQGLRWHFMREIEERGSEAVIADAIAEALDGPDSIYLSLDIDVIDPGMAPGTGTPEPGGMLTREVLRAIRQIVGCGRSRGDGHRRGVATVRSGRDDGRGRQPGGTRGDQRPRREAARRRPGPLGGLTIDRSPLDRPDAASAAALARLYDLDLVDDPGDLDLFLALADRAEGPILELAVGTGRLAIPLAEAGHLVTGVDLDPAMLERARDRVRGNAGEDRLTLIEADIVGSAAAR